MTVKVACSVCSKDITILGSAICGICDPNFFENVVMKGGKSITPSLCDSCFEEHKEQHKITKK